MEFLKNNARGIIISLLVAGAIIGIANVSNDDTSTNEEAETTQNEETQNETKDESTEKSEESSEETSTDESSSEDQKSVTSTDDAFVSTTANGDNQTVVVRRMVDNYLSGSDAELSAEQKLYVETNLVNDLGRTDFIPVGQEIKLAKETIAKRVEEARNLSEAAIARWSAYL